jgi:5-methyltetrahydropteroyltriglutamate--homocysteine methyltransferase
LKVKGFSLGIFPKSEKLIRIIRRNPSKVIKAIKAEEIRDVITQIKLNLSFISDPMLNFEDLLRPFTNFEGIQAGALSRFYETNTFYRKPIIKSKIREGKESHYLSRITYSKKEFMYKNLSWKAELPEPYTFATLSENKAYDKFENLVLDLANALAVEAKLIEMAKYSLILLRAPELAYNPNKKAFEYAKKGIKIISESTKLKLFLNLYFGDCSYAIKELSKFDYIDGLVIDFKHTPVNVVSYVKGKELGLGIVDTGNTKMEDKEELFNVVKKVNELGFKRVYITPNVDLEYLPRKFALKKLRVISSLIKRWEDNE